MAILRGHRCLKIDGLLEADKFTFNGRCSIPSFFPHLRINVYKVPRIVVSYS